MQLCPVRLLQDDKVLLLNVVRNQRRRFRAACAFAQKGATMFKFLQCGSALQIEVVAMNSKSLVRQEKDGEEVAKQFFDKWYSQGSG